jgi:hypothetical protein
MYRRLVARMLEDAARLEDHRATRFEDIISHPVRLVRKICLQLKPAVDRQGRQRLAGGNDRQVVWYDLDDLASHFRPDVNENQIRELAPGDRETFLRIAPVRMERLGYLYSLSPIVR